VDALGKKGVVGVAMPLNTPLKNQWRMQKSWQKNLGIQFLTIPLQRYFKLFKDTFSAFSGTQATM